MCECFIVCLLADTVSKPSLDTLRNQVEEVRSAMSANISQVMNRGEKLDDLELKVEMQADMFMKASTESLDETMDEMYYDEIIFNEPTILSLNELFGDTSCLLSDDLYEDSDITISVREKIDMIVCT